MFNPKKWWLCIPDYNDPEFIKKRDLIQDHYIINHKKISKKKNERVLRKLDDVYQDLYFELNNHDYLLQCSLLKNNLDLCPEYVYHYILSFDKFDVKLTILSKHLNILVVEFFIAKRYLDPSLENLNQPDPDKTLNYSIDKYNNLDKNDICEILSEIERYLNG